MDLRSRGEALPAWAAQRLRILVAGRSGGIRLQVREGRDGYLIEDEKELGPRPIDLLTDLGSGRLG